jgi:hypothetical protein
MVRNSNTMLGSRTGEMALTFFLILEKKTYHLKYDVISKFFDILYHVKEDPLYCLVSLQIKSFFLYLLNIVHDFCLNL